MSSTLCATLLTVFPVLLLISVVEGRAVSPVLRRNFVYTLGVAIGACFGLAGTGLTVLGVDDGLDKVAGGFAWVFFYGHLLCVVTLVLLLFVTYDREDGRVSAFWSRKRHEAAALVDEKGQSIPQVNVADTKESMIKKEIYDFEFRLQIRRKCKKP